MSTSVHSTAQPITVGDPAPDFTLPSQAGEPITLGNLLGRSAIVLYFYPKDSTAGCTAEACAFRDSFETFAEAGAQVIGVSSDSVASHGAFASAHRLPFPLLSDVDGAVRRRYGVAKWLGLLPGRVTFVIDRLGIVRHIFKSQLGVTRHVEEALGIVERLGTRP